ncbi:phosphatase PAP2 family protein [Spirosoma sp. KUDC1026]|uniref:phosphatase PAP2 family protein n=1 Tax=Spirosoma sp. KUDC1026 TaxID=2745947 RepID=UPI00159BB75E|nr:phosphatase PAP2 family protein [Spirosoma sp. KUDC1026]QKZ14286.1 phosphatase PAP2 family protein [Spirosoma sp. KUDC1026]
MLHRFRTTIPSICLTLWLSVNTLVGVAQPGVAQPIGSALVPATRADRISPYQLTTRRELVLAGAGVVSLGTSAALTHQLDLLSPAEINALSRGSINAFDRGATYRWNPTLDRISDVTFAGNVALVGLLSVGTRPMRQDIKTVAVMYLETALLTNGIGRTVKAVTLRTRPYVYNPAAPLDEKETKDARQSFFSGHASNAFATAVFTSEVFRHYFPNSGWKPVVWVGSLGLATATAVFRYEAGLHYPTDLLVGAAFGSLVGWGIPKLHEVKNRSSLGQRLDVQPWSNGSANGIYLRLLTFSR